MSDLYDVKISVRSSVKLLPEIKGLLSMKPNRERFLMKLNNETVSIELKNGTVVHGSMEPSQGSPWDLDGARYEAVDVDVVASHAMSMTNLSSKKKMDISNSNDDRTKQLKAFDDTKSGVKGLFDAAAGGAVDIPQIFIQPPEEVAEDLELTRTSLRVPAIDLTGVGDKRSCTREKIVEQVKHASEKWGFFQVVNHGVPMKVLEAMLNGAREFNEQDVEVKKEYYSRDPERMVKFNTNYDFYMSKSATWRDTLIVDMLNSNHLDPQHLPSPCRNATVDYLDQVKELADTLFELLSEALGLEPNHLKQLECEKSQTLVCHYYPPCPKPDQTLGLNKHTDASFISILLQDEVGGLQVLHQNQWADVEPIPGALVVNIGDLLQIVSNDKFKSVIHRALGNVTRARTSVAYFLHGVVTPPKMYGPIERIITKESPRLFGEFTIKDYMMKFYSRGLDEKSGLNYVRI